MAKEDGFQEGIGDGGAIDGNVGLAGTLGQLMDLPRKNIFTNPRFPGEEGGGIGLTNPFTARHNGKSCRIDGNNFLGSAGFFALGWTAFALVAADHLDQLFWHKRLNQKVPGTSAQGFNSKLGIRIRGHHHHR